MNRFFSKLNLQDIKINPEGHHFPPDADEQDGQADVPATEAVATEDPPVDQYSPTREVPSAPVMPAAPEQRPEPETILETAFEPMAEESVQVDPVHSSGHAVEELGTAVEYVADSGVVAIAGEVLKVSARSRPSAVAGAIAGVVREAGRAEVQAIGAGATNQAVKAVAIARDYLSETGIDAICVPAFIDVTIDNEDRTAIRLVVEPR